MSQSFNVIALISGGKDSIYSILHCLENGHKVVALGNVYPLPLGSKASQGCHVTQEIEPDEDYLNSHMYQTVGHTVVPLYEQALGIPLYRQPITGKALATEATYEKPADSIDETESLVPLLQRIMLAHPEANAVSTGAILSTYQRTRVESVALRLGLLPLSFLWQYPRLPPVSNVSLLLDMASATLDARIIKTASWALNESFLWQNVASEEVIQRIEHAMTRFGNEDGAALGEGGEFETLALDGPDHLFKGRIVVQEEDRLVIQGSAVTAWIRVNKARVEMKTCDEKVNNLSVRIPDLLSDDFHRVYQTLVSLAESENFPSVEHRSLNKTSQLRSTRIPLKSVVEGQKWTIVGFMRRNSTIKEELEQIIAQIRESLDVRVMRAEDVISTLILLRSMSNFAVVNKIYGSLFSKPNPPARVTVACGDLLPPGYNVIVQLSVSSGRGHRRPTDDLHVQSRSYWAPANIGPYSQARSDVIDQCTGTIGFVHVAGQIPLVPSTMTLPEVEVRPSADEEMMTDLADPNPIFNSYQLSRFIRQTVLSLQHLWRIGQTMDVCWWTGAVAYLSKDTSSNISWKARLAAEAWSKANGGRWQERFEDESDAQASGASDEDERDPWEERYHKAFMQREAAKTPVKKLPDWSIVKADLSRLSETKLPHQTELPAFFAAEVEELPRDSAIEWHTLLGVTRGPITQMMSDPHKSGNILKSILASQLSQTFVFLKYKENIPDLAQLIDELLSEIETPHEAELRKASPGYHHSYTAYLDASVAGLWDADSYAGVIPCRSLWGVDGPGVERLAAVLVFQCFLETEEGDDDD